MVEHPSDQPAAHEEGTTLVELLVVMTLLAIVGTITTVGIVSGFGAQLDATNVAETLDGTRIATQRVRDFVRGADEVCASSTQDALVLWTDDDGDGIVVDSELDIFELVPSGTDEVFQRRVPSVSGDTIQLIRDDIINTAVFTYDTAPGDQPDDLICTDGVTPTNGPNAIRVVSVEFTVENPDPTLPALTTATQVRLRNAELVAGPGNESPVAAFTFSCPAPLTCDFDASGSSDPDGSITSYDWTFTDELGVVVATATGVSPSVVFPLGDVDYEAELVVTDNEAAVDDVVQIVTPVAIGSNAPPTAAFTFSCAGLVCSFDASGSSDADGTIDTYAWDFGDGTTGSGVTASRTYLADGSYVVTLEVTDDDGATDDQDTTVTADNQAIYVSSLTATKQAAGNKIEFTVALQRTAGGDPGSGLLVTLDIDPADGGVFQDSCPTNSSGACTFVVNVNKNNSYPVVAEVASVTNTGPYVYDEDQNTDDTETVS